MTRFLAAKALEEAVTCPECWDDNMVARRLDIFTVLLFPIIHMAPTKKALEADHK